MNILIEGIDILTGDPKTEYIGNAHIGIKDDKIEFIAAASEMPVDFKADRVISGRNRIAMPGLVNAHTHCAILYEKCGR